MLSKEEIDRIADEILAGLKEGKEEKKPANKPVKEIPGLSVVADVKAEASVRENRKKQEQEILEAAAGSVPKSEGKTEQNEAGEDELKEKDWRAPLIDDPQDPDALQRMMAKTTARIGVGRCGPRLKTQTLLKLRADHAAARDAVMMDVSEKLVSDLGLFPVKTLCEDKNVFLTRPDLGRDFSDETKKEISEHCLHDIDVQIIVSDGLSSSSIEANAPKILPIVMEGLKEKGISTGTPIFVKFGRVAAQDRISELLNARIVCSFIGERPGLATAESMSVSYRITCNNGNQRTLINP